MREGDSGCVSNISLRMRGYVTPSMVSIIILYAKKKERRVLGFVRTQFVGGGDAQLLLEFLSSGASKHNAIQHLWDSQRTTLHNW